MAHLLGAEAVHLEYSTQVVFESVTVGISDGDRIGIVGRNGDGKSSLLDLLTGQVRPDAGYPIPVAVADEVRDRLAQKLAGVSEFGAI